MDLPPMDERDPVVLIIAGNDPSGGAGVCADIQAASALGAYPAPVITALTVQDTRDAYEVQAADPELVLRQVQRVVADLPIAAVKLGLLASAAIGEAVAEALEGSDAPLVLDPVLVAAGGAALAEDELIATYRDRLFALATVVTPNVLELERFGGCEAILEAGADTVLRKGGDADTEMVDNSLHGTGGELASWSWDRVPGQHHGSGCTLASALAACLAHGMPLDEAATYAQSYTWQAIASGSAPGGGQRVPRRRTEVWTP